MQSLLQDLSIDVVCELSAGDGSRRSGVREAERFVLEGDKYADGTIKARAYFVAEYMFEEAGRHELAKECRQWAFRSLQLALRNELSDFHMTVLERPRPRKQRRRVTVSSPVRVEFSSGGCSDLFPITEIVAGGACTMAITADYRRPVTVTIEKQPHPVVVLRSLDSGWEDEYPRLSDRKGEDCPNPADPCRVAREVLAGAFGVNVRSGEDVRRFLKWFGSGVSITTNVDGVPVGSGLGVSSIVSCCVALGFAEMMGENVSNLFGVASSMRTDSAIGILGGWQDSAAVLNGGFSKWLCKKGSALPNASDWQIGDGVSEEINRRLLLVYVGHGHEVNLLPDVVRKFCLGDKSLLFGIGKAKRLPELMCSALEEGDVSRFGRLIAQNWNLICEICGDGMSTPSIRKLIGEVSHFVDGARASGAGAGGVVVLVAQDGKESELRAAVDRMCSETDCRVVPHGIDGQGILIEAE